MAKRKAEIKLAVWLLTTKSRESFDFLACRWHATYHWKALDKGYNFFSKLISIGGLHAKLWASKVTEVLILRISGLSFRSPETKWCLAVGPMAKHRVYYKGEGDGFPHVRVVVSFLSLCCSWLVRAPKCSNYALTNFVWFVQVCVSDWIACQSS